MADQIIIGPDADGNVVAQEGRMSKTSVNPAGTPVQTREQAQLNITDDQIPAGGGLPANPTPAQLQRAQMDPRYKTDRDFRNQVIAAYRNMGNNQGRPGDVMRSEEGQVNQADDGQAEHDDAAQEAEALANQQLNEEEIAAWQGVQSDLDAEFGEGAFGDLADAVIDMGELDQETIANLEAHGFDYEAIVAAGVEAGGAVLAQAAGSLGYTVEGLQAFEKAVERSGLGKQLAGEIVRGNTAPLMDALRTFKAQNS